MRFNVKQTAIFTIHSFRMRARLEVAFSEWTALGGAFAVCVHLQRRTSYARIIYYYTRARICAHDQHTLRRRTHPAIEREREKNARERERNHEKR